MSHQSRITSEEDLSEGDDEKILFWYRDDMGQKGSDPDDINYRFLPPDYELHMRVCI